MDRTHDLIREAIEVERVVFSIHADNQLATRDVERWQAVAGFADGRLIGSEPTARPNPKILVEGAAGWRHRGRRVVVRPIAAVGEAGDPILSPAMIRPLVPSGSETIKRFVETDELVVVVEVPVVYAEEEPDEPLLTAETIRFLDEVRRHAHAGDRGWLEGVGRVYARASA